MPTVCAIVLTYNRAALVDACLTTLTRQTRPCDRIIVIDNASTDDTLARLREKWSDRVTIHSLPKNIGAAGGYSAGMHLAYLTGADFVLTMDDDIELQPDTLERLLEAHAFLAAEKIAPPFLVAVSHTANPNVFDTPDIDLNAPWPRFLDKGLLPIRRSAVNAMLFARETFAKHGLPLAEMFIWGEDTEFTLRVSRETPGYVVGAAKILHVRDLPGTLDIRTEENAGRVAYHRYLKRNRIYVMRKNTKPLSVLRQLARETGIVLQLALQGRLDRAWIVLSGVTEGLFFNPRRRSADAPFDFTGVRTFGIHAAEVTSPSRALA